MGHAMHTPGGLTKADLMVNSRGKVVSAARSAAASMRRAAGGMPLGGVALGGERRQMYGLARDRRYEMAGGIGLGTGILSGLLGSIGSLF